MTCGIVLGTILQQRKRGKIDEMKNCSITRNKRGEEEGAKASTQTRQTGKRAYVMQSMMGHTERQSVQPVQSSFTFGRWVTGSKWMAW